MENRDNSLKKVEKGSQHCFSVEGSSDQDPDEDDQAHQAQNWRQGDGREKQLLEGINLHIL